MKKNKIIYWMDEGAPAEITIDAPVVETTPEQPIVAQTEETSVANEVDVAALMKDIASLKEMLQAPTKVVKLETALPVVEAKPVTNVLEIANFANIGLNEDQEKTIQAHIQSVQAKNDSVLEGYKSQIAGLTNELTIKRTDETSTISQIQAAYEEKLTLALSHINALESQVTSMGDQMKTKDELISKKDNAEFLNSELKAKPWLEDLVKAAKVTTRDQYITLIAPMEAREKKVWEQSNRYNNSNNVLRNINTTTTMNQDKPKVNKGLDFIKNYITT